MDDSFLDDILGYVHNEDTDRPRGKIKTGLILSTPGRNAQQALFQGWKGRQPSTSTEILIRLQPSHATNLQIALKNVIKLAICQEGDLEEYANYLAANKAMIPMNFDLELLERYGERHGISRILVSLLDVETFDTAILSELISTFSSWSDRIPFILLINISTTIELFESRLSRSVIGLLDAQVFQPLSSKTQDDHLFEVYSAIQGSEDAELFLGPSIIGVLADLAQDQSTTVESFISAIKYVFMSHFFANPLSVLTTGSDVSISENPALSTAIRNTRGFKTNCEWLAKGNKTQRQQARELLASDEALEKQSLKMIESGPKHLRSSLKAIRTLQQIHRQLSHVATSALEVQAQLLASLPDLTQSETFEVIESALLDMPSGDEFRAFITSTSDVLEDLKQYEPPGPRGNDDDIVTFADIETALDESVAAQKFLTLLRNYLTSRTSPGPTLSSNPFRAFMSESYAYTLKSPLSAVLHPRARYSLERALTRPSDYLGCDCCVAEKPSGIILDRSTLPPTSLLLTMLNEAGSVVNVRDLWDAFRNTISTSPSFGKGGGNSGDIDRPNPPSNGVRRGADEGEGSDQDQDEGEGEEEDKDGDTGDEATTRTVLALFYRSLADLRHMGLIRPSKRKPGVDCIAKTAWMGL